MWAQSDTVAEMPPAVAGESRRPHPLRTDRPHVSHRHTRANSGDHRGERLAQGTVDGLLLGGGIQGVGATDVAVVAADVDLHVEFTVCPGPTATGTAAVPDRNQTFDLPQRGEPVVARRSVPDGALIGCRHADSAQPRPQRVTRTGDAGLRQLSGQAQMRDLVGVLDRA